MTAWLDAGWIMAAYNGDDMSIVELSLGRGSPTQFVPAFLDNHEGQRVAKVRPHAFPDLVPRSNYTVFLKVNGGITEAGMITTP